MILFSHNNPKYDVVGRRILKQQDMAPMWNASWQQQVLSKGSHCACWAITATPNIPRRIY
jgi:hypothetical protein